MTSTTTTKFLYAALTVTAIALAAFALPFVAIALHALGGLAGTVPATSAQLDGLTVKRLRPMARDRKVAGWHGARKAVLVAALRGRVTVAQLRA